METISKQLVEETVSLAETWQIRADELITAEEKEIQERMNRLLTHPMDRIILTQLIDQSFRPRNHGRIADQINSLFKAYGIPTFFPATDKLLVQIFRGFGRYLPGWSVPKVIDKMRHDSNRVIIPGEKEPFRLHLTKRKQQGIRLNINHIGEAVLGEEEATSRVQMYIDDLKEPDIECISAKISTLYSQINPLDFENTVDVLKDRLSLLFKASDQHYFVRDNGQRVKKFVNLDMEEYRDLDITVTAFKRALEETGLNQAAAGIALQAYLPDSYDMQKKLTEWARRRVARGGSPIKVRLVKGANLEMERVDAAINGWPLAPYDNKPDVDANYKRMVTFGLAPENIQSVHLGIASHNLFDLAYGVVLARNNGVEEYVTIEMLEGMANHVARAVRETVPNLLLYAPVVAADQFINAIAYLVRRLDENTSGENFLRYAGSMKAGSVQWAHLESQFIDSARRMDKPRIASHRVQNRLTEDFSEPAGTFRSGEFRNEPDTDWSLSVNRQWADRIRQEWKKQPGEVPMDIPLVIGDHEVFNGRTPGNVMDISRLPDTVCVARYAQATGEDVEQAVQTAKDDPDGWRELNFNERRRLLFNVARELRASRADLIGAAAANTGKIFTESDPEVSEAVDFAEFYPFAAHSFHEMTNLSCRGKGVGVIISPWNFPISIPCGGILAALAAGNTVIFKPASAAVLVAWQICQAIWRAGISRNVLQFLPCPGEQTGARLTNHPDVAFIILTGGTDTGLSILKKNPGVFLAAETGGKNVTIVTAMADRDRAVKHVIHSAFSNSGQKCSATSLLILEEEVYSDPDFKQQLVDATKSLAVGSVWDFKHKIGPLIHPPSGMLKEVLDRLEPGESWALRPENRSGNPCLWTPGIKWGVVPESTSYQTELFGPVLGVMKAKDLDHAIELANGTGYGLTSAIETLDKREQKRWTDGIEAGNLYINRGTTGAMVLRQPFGGMKKSSLGAGIKVGFYNYVTQFMDIEDRKPPSAGAIEKDHYLLRLVQDWESKIKQEEYRTIREDLLYTIRAVKSYLYHYEQEFSRRKDYMHIRGQDNIVCYLPVGKVMICLHPLDSLFDILSRIAASMIAKCDPVVNQPPDLENPATDFLQSEDGKRFLGKIPVVHLTEKELIEAMDEVHRFRYADPDRVPDGILAAASRKAFYISRSAVLMEGRIELLHYFREQSICDTYHRYGNLGERALIESK